MLRAIGGFALLDDRSFALKSTDSATIDRWRSLKLNAAALLRCRVAQFSEVIAYRQRSADNRQWDRSMMARTSDRITERSMDSANPSIMRIIFTYTSRHFYAGWLYMSFSDRASISMMPIWAQLWRQHSLCDSCGLVPSSYCKRFPFNQELFSGYVC